MIPERIIFVSRGITVLYFLPHKMHSFPEKCPQKNPCHKNQKVLPHWIHKNTFLILGCLLSLTYIILAVHLPLRYVSILHNSVENVFLIYTKEILIFNIVPLINQEHKLQIHMMAKTFWSIQRLQTEFGLLYLKTISTHVNEWACTRARSHTHTHTHTQMKLRK